MTCCIGEQRTAYGPIMSKWDDFEVSVPYQCRVGNPPTCTNAIWLRETTQSKSSRTDTFPPHALPPSALQALCPWRPGLQHRHAQRP